KRLRSIRRSHGVRQASIEASGWVGLGTYWNIPREGGQVLSTPARSPGEEYLHLRFGPVKQVGSIILLFLQVGKHKRGPHRRRHRHTGATYRTPNDLIEQQIVNRVFLGKIELLRKFSAKGSRLVLLRQVHGGDHLLIRPQVRPGLERGIHGPG